MIKLPLRYTVYMICLTAFAVALARLPHNLLWAWPAVLFGALSALGTWDVLQRKRSVSCNYPILAHLRYFLEGIGPEIRQYFIEADTDERPFSREQRSIVYRRAKNTLDKKPFGSLLDIYAPGYEWINHSMVPSQPPSHDFRVTVGEGREQPYRASVFNISAMSYGALSANAISALNRGAAKGGFYHDTGEGAISRYHLQGGADLVWEIGSGYFGCRNPDGTFNADRFAEKAALNAVKMIEIKLSQGAKPGHGGILPAAKVTEEIAEVRGVPLGQDVVSPAAHSAFTTPLELIGFIVRLRKLSGGKPVGIKLALGHPWEWFGIAKAMLESGEHPDFIVVDGGEGGTGAAPLEFINRIGMPMDEALLLVHNTLVGTGLRDRVRIAAAGKITSSFKIVRAMALGADWCNAARGFMFSLGCIQALNCHTDHCPSGVATQDRRRSRALDVTDKSERVYNFHTNTLKALHGLLSAAGLNDTSEISPHHLFHRVSKTEILTYAELLDFLQPGELLDETPPHHRIFRDYWPSARSDAFLPSVPSGTATAASSATGYGRHAAV